MSFVLSISSSILFLQVRAFNLNGGGQFSKIQYGRTNGKIKKKKSRKPKQAEKLNAIPTPTGEVVADEDATLYLIIGISLGLICVVGLGVCSVITCLQRRKRSSKFSDTNAAIHSKYQDTSLQITGQHQVSNHNQTPLK